MKRGLVVAVILGVLLPSPAFAQAGQPDGGGPAQHGGKPTHHKPRQPQHQPGHSHHGGSSHGHGGPHHRPSPYEPGHRPPQYGRPPRPTQFYHHGQWYGRAHGPVYVYPRGWHYRRWPIGAHLPRVFLAPTYFYPDYVGLGLAPPPPGYAWVRYGPDLLLVNLQTGIVDDVVYGAFY